MFNPSAVWIFLSIHFRLLSGIFPKHIVQLWCWYIFDVSFVIFFEVRHKYTILIACNILLFTCDLLIFIACGLFNCFAHIFLITLIIIVFVVHIYLMIFFIPTSLFLWNCTFNIYGNIDSNVYSVFNICGALFRIRVEPFQLFSSHKTVFNVFVVKSILCHNIFYINDR